MRKLSGVIGMFIILIVVGVSGVYVYIKTHQIVQFITDTLRKMERRG